MSDPVQQTIERLMQERARCTAHEEHARARGLDDTARMWSDQLLSLTYATEVFKKCAGVSK